MTENEVNEEPLPPAPAEPDRSWQSKLKRIAPFAAGLAAFALGLLLFAPLEAYTYLALRQAGASGVHVDISDLSLSVFGKFKAQSIKIPLSADAEKGGVLKIAEAKGNASLLGFLTGDKYDATAEAVILSFSRGDFGIKIDSLEIISALNQAKTGGTTKSLNGNLSLVAESAQVTYKETKFLKEDIVVPFLKVMLKCRAQDNRIGIETGEAIGRLINMQIRGSVTLGPQTELSLNLVLKPTDEFYQKYQDKDLRTLLKFANILQDDGRIEFNVRGTLNQPIVEPVLAKTAAPAPAAPAAPR